MTCIRGNYNLTVKTIDKDNMVYLDLSDWMTSPGNYTISITKPATSQPIAVEVSGTITTRISSEQLGTIIDGVYTFETDSCGIRYKRYKGLFYLLECCIKQAYLDISPSHYDKIWDVEDSLKETNAAIERNNLELANDLYEITKAKMDRIKCDCGC